MGRIRGLGWGEEGRVGRREYDGALSGQTGGKGMGRGGLLYGKGNGGQSWGLNSADLRMVQEFND